jgi:hypothetical protein
MVGHELEIVASAVPAGTRLLASHLPGSSCRAIFISRLTALISRDATDRLVESAAQKV